MLVDDKSCGSHTLFNRLRIYSCNCMRVLTSKKTTVPAQSAVVTDEAHSSVKLCGKFRIDQAVQCPKDLIVATEHHHSIQGLKH